MNWRQPRERSDTGRLSFDARGVVGALPFAALLVGLDDEVLAANAAADALFQAGGRAIGGTPLKFTELPPSYSVPGLHATLEGVKRGTSPAMLHGVRCGEPDPPAAYDLTLQPIRGRDRDVVAVLLVAIDVTSMTDLRATLEALRLEHDEMVERQATDGEALATANEELRTANEVLQDQIAKLEAAELADVRKNQFLAMLAHELRNPLGALSNALHVIRRRTARDHEVHRALGIAERQLRHEARLLDDLLDVSRIVFGKVTLQSQVIDLRQCVRNVVEGAAFARQAKALDLHVDVPHEPLTVVGDAVRLEQCVGNLVNNAIKFTPPGGHVNVSARRDAADAVVTVRDTGVGIEPEMLARVFELFSQADVTLARAHGGLGIGLTLVRTLVELHGGTVAARSEGSERGAEFELRVPLTAESSTLGVTTRDAAATSPRRILVVEDNADAREMLRVLLEMEGHTVVDTGAGITAVRLAAEMVPDVALIDIGLPGLDGFEVARRIRHRLGQRVRLVALSGYADVSTIEEGRAAGFDAHLVKPVSPDDLARTLADVRAR